MKQKPGSKADSLQAVFDYHAATKHDYNRYSPGPGYLDWANQPNPLRFYEGARLVPLAKIPATDTPLYDDVFVSGRIASVPLNLQSISRLFFDSLALSAWKVAGGSRWALRINPSSGNLHPTEAYLICGLVEGLSDTPMVCHYTPLQHGLEVLAEFDITLWKKLSAGFPKHTVFMVLTAIHWREAWKYGQRAYRYCQHDAGHAVAAISIAAAGLGWQAKLLDGPGADELALLTGTFRKHNAETEEPDLLLALCPSGEVMHETTLAEEPVSAFASLDWQGHPNPLSASRVEWGMDEIAAAVRKSRSTGRYEPLQGLSKPIALDIRPLSFRKIIHQRRSAVAMDGVTWIPRDTFFRILQKTVAAPGNIPFNTLPWKSHIHLVIFVHRVDDLPSGLYILVRDPSQQKALETAFTGVHGWKRVIGCPDSLELYCLAEADVQKAAQQVSCLQKIASDGCFSLGMIAGYQESLECHGPWFYPRLFWEAGVIGQVLYLEAEAAGIRGTGIGCYFDDPVHDILGIKDSKYQDIYHFTVGGPVEDSRLTTLPAYPDSSATG